MKPVLLDKQQFMSAFPEGRKFVDLSFFDQEGKPASLGQSLADGKGKMLIARDDIDQKYHAFMIGPDGDLKPALPEDVLDSKKTVRETMAEIKGTMDATVKKDLSDAGKMYHITMGLRKKLKDLEKNEHWYIRGSDQYRTMKERLLDAIAYGEKGNNFSVFHEKLRDLSEASKNYVTKKTAEPNKSKLAQDRLDGVTQLRDYVGRQDDTLTRDRLGNEEAKFYDTIRKNLGEAACNKLQGRKAEINEMLVSYKATKERLIAKMNGGNIIKPDADEARAVCGYYTILHNAKYGDGSFIDTICKKGVVEALRKDIETKPYVEKDSLTNPNRIPGYKKDTAYTEKDFDEQMEWFECRCLMYRESKDRESADYFDKTGRISPEEYDATKLLRITDARAKEDAQKAGKSFDRPVFDAADLNAYIAAKSEQARLTHMAKLDKAKAQRAIESTKEGGATIIHDHSFAAFDEITRKYDKRLPFFENNENILDIRSKVANAKEVLLKNRAQKEAEEAAARQKQLEAEKNKRLQNGKQAGTGAKGAVQSSSKK